MSARRPLAVLLACLALLVAFVGLTVLDTTRAELREVVVPVPGLSREITVVQASDLHAEEFGAHESELADLLRGKHVDAAVITGDTLDNENQARQAAYDLADVLRAATPRVYLLIGNHDPADLGSSLVSHGVKILSPGLVMPLTSTDDRAKEAGLVYGGDSASIGAASGSASKLLVVASHTPPNATRLAAGKKLPGTHLFIAGHTHGGQVRLPLIGALAAPTTWEAEEGGVPDTNEIRAFPDLRGYLILGSYERDGQRIYVSPGLGVTWLRWRFLDRAALVLYRFVPEGR